MNLEKIKEASKVLQEGGVILVATETVWGLSCNADDEQAIEKIKQIKKRGDQGFIVLVKNDAMMERYVNDVPDIAYDIIDQSVSPITIIYPRGVYLPDTVFHQDGSVAIRVTKDEVLQRLISAIKKPLVSTSANVHGKPSAVRLEDVDQTILDAVDYVLDLSNGNQLSGKASTILKIGLKGEIDIIRK